MLSKKHRLTAPQVREILKTGRSLRVSAVSLKYAPAKLGAAAVVVSKRVVGKATGRNALRRAAYKALPSPLPKANLVFFVQKSTFDPKEISVLCSKLF